MNHRGALPSFSTSTPLRPILRAVTASYFLLGMLEGLLGPGPALLVHPPPLAGRAPPLQADEDEQQGEKQVPDPGPGTG
ncbi:hypothetical protein SERLA73DRAFT_133272 [Serpula lacrymans var. lacrymans S7.3]|uniref:Uncharacterized protein n=1 Tax=Serpula lacrymans var. lacrymans (strain S7.3) TaxID=936435 RepID=F8PQX1_SERL3|nr:hypothetical protein SERLA73DRAFT_133272 [Serpula lacrymans var. lacrymans S7.3]